MHFLTFCLRMDWCGEGLHHKISKLQHSRANSIVVWREGLSSETVIGLQSGTAIKSLFKYIYVGFTLVQLLVLLLASAQICSWTLLHRTCDHINSTLPVWTWPSLVTKLYIRLWFMLCHSTCVHTMSVSTQSAQQHTFLLLMTVFFPYLNKCLLELLKIWANLVMTWRQTRTPQIFPDELFHELQNVQVG